MIIQVSVTAASLASAVGLGMYDAKKTLQGIAKGVGVESNGLINLIAGSNKPGLGALLTYNLGEIALLAVPGLILAFQSNPFFLPFAILLATLGLQHLVGGKNWAYLITGGNPNPTQTAFQKFIGLLSWNEGA